MPLARIPLSWPYAERGNSTAKDSRRINVMDEKNGDTVYTVKRPGSTTAYTSIAAGAGQGLTKYNGMVYAVTGDKLQSVSAAGNSGTDGATWTSLGPVPWSPRWGHQCQVLNGTIYVLGGNVTSSNIPSSDVWALGIKTPWSQVSAGAPWGGRRFFGSCVLHGRIYVMGGYNPTLAVTYNDVWSSDNGSDWTLETSVAQWTPRLGMMVVSTGQGIYVMGGVDGAGTINYNDVWFSADGITWSSVTTEAWGTGGGRQFAQTYWYNNQVWVVGGTTTAIAYKREVWSSPDGKTWTLVTNTPTWTNGIILAGACVYNNKMWMINGETVGGATSKVYTSTDGATWTLVTSSGPGTSDAAQAVVAPTATAVNANNYGTIYYLGGRDSGAAALNNVYYGAFNTSVSTSTSLTTSPANQPFQFSTFYNGTLLAFKNQSNLWILQGNTVIQIGDTRYPSNTVPGLVELDARLYVMDPTGLIRNSNIDDPFNWPLLNAVGADFEDDAGVYLAKYMNYVMAFGTYTVQVFYDAGVSVGSPLAPYLNAALKIGCASAATVAYFGPNIAWVSQTRELYRQVMVMEGLTPKVISTPFIEKLLKDASLTDLKAILFSVPGHLFYVLQYDSLTPQPSLVYDFTTQNWYEWTAANGSDPYLYAAVIGVLDSSPGTTLALDQILGTIYNLTPDAYKDVASTFPVTLITQKVDYGNNHRKFYTETTLIGDLNTGTPGISWTDDDYQNYNTARTVDTTQQRAVLFRCGNGRRRAFKVEVTNNNPIRWESLEVDYEQGQT